MTGANIRVLHISPFKQSISGSDESLLELIVKLRASGFDSFVAVPKQSPYLGRYTDAGAKLVHLPVKSIRRSLRPDKWALLMAGVASDLLGLRSLLKDLEINLVHTNMETAPAGPMAARNARKPSIVHVRSTSISRPKWVFNGLVKFLTRYADRAVAISDSVYKMMADGGFPEKRLVRIYDPVDTGLYRPRTSGEAEELFAEKLAPAGIPAGGRLIGLIGRMNPIKGQETLLDAAAVLAGRHEDVHFVLVGDAADDAERKYEAALRRKAAKLGIENRTHFLGHRPDVMDLLPLFKVSVSPSTTEAFGRPAAEAMACGIPAVVAATDGLKEIVEDGQTGYVVPPRDPQALEDAIEKVLSDPDRAAQMGRKGRERVIANFSADIHASKMKALFESLL